MLCYIRCHVQDYSLLYHINNKPYNAYNIKNRNEEPCRKPHNVYKLLTVEYLFEFFFL